MSPAPGCPHRPDYSTLPLRKLFPPRLQADHAGVCSFRGVLRTVQVLCSLLLLLYCSCHSSAEMSTVQIDHLLLYGVFWCGFQLSFHLVYWVFLFPTYQFGHFSRSLLKILIYLALYFFLYSTVYCFSIACLISIRCPWSFKFVLWSFSFKVPFTLVPSIFVTIQRWAWWRVLFFLFFWISRLTFGHLLEMVSLLPLLEGFLNEHSNRMMCLGIVLYSVELG